MRAAVAVSQDPDDPLSGLRLENREPEVAPEFRTLTRRVLRAAGLVGEDVRDGHK